MKPELSHDFVNVLESFRGEEVLRWIPIVLIPVGVALEIEIDLDLVEDLGELLAL